MAATQAVPQDELPVGVLRPLQESLEPVVLDGVVWEPRKGKAVSDPAPTRLAGRAELPHRSRRPSEPNRGDLGQDPQCSLVGAPAAEVETDWPVHT